MCLRPGKPPLSTEFLDAVEIDLRRDEWLRYLGYPRASSIRSIAPELEVLLETGQSYLQPRIALATYAIEARSREQLVIGGHAVHGRVASFLAAAERIVVFALTVGREISDAAAAASKSGDIVKAWGLDALGSYAAEATAEGLSERLRQRHAPDESVSPRYSPGYCGMQLDQQRVIFELLEVSAIGVTLEPSMTMQPTKTISGILGIGPSNSFVVSGTPCDRCGAINCAMRR